MNKYLNLLDDINQRQTNALRWVNHVVARDHIGSIKFLVKHNFLPDDKKKKQDTAIICNEKEVRIRNGAALVGE